MPDVCNCEALANSILIGGGLQGFHSPIVQDSFIVDGIGALGTKQSERKLTYVEISLSGHM
jgi:carboxypeptidase D